MSKELEAGMGWPCHLELKRKKIVQGINSEVFQSGLYALKIYKTVDDPGTFLNKEKLLLYREITNLASSLAKSEKWTVKLPFPYGLYQVEVNPFPELKKCEKCGDWEGRVPYIPGSNLRMLPLSFIYSGWGVCFSGLNYKVEKSLFVKGIFISPVNVKKLNSSTLVITDLCDDIGALERDIH